MAVWANTLFQGKTIPPFLLSNFKYVVNQKALGRTTFFASSKNIDHPFLQTPALKGRRIIFLEVSFMYNPEAKRRGNLLKLSLPISWVLDTGGVSFLNRTGTF